MSEMRPGSRYELQRDRKGAAEAKAAGDYYAVHPGDIEETQEEDDLVGYLHSYEVGSTVDRPGLRFVISSAKGGSVTHILPKTDIARLEKALQQVGDRLSK